MNVQGGKFIRKETLREAFQKNSWRVKNAAFFDCVL